MTDKKPAMPFEAPDPDAGPEEPFPTLAELAERQQAAEKKKR